MKEEDFMFDDMAKNSITTLQSSLEEKLTTIYQDTTKTQDDIYGEINIINISITVININQTITNNYFDDTLSKIQLLTNKLQEKSEQNEDIDLYTSYEQLQKELEESNTDDTISLDDKIKEVENNIDDYIVQKEEMKTEIEPPYFPTIGGYTMPALDIQ